MEVLTLPITEDLDVPDATPGVGFACPDLTVFCRLEELGLVAIGQRLEAERAVLACPRGGAWRVPGSTASLFLDSGA